VISCAPTGDRGSFGSRNATGGKTQHQLLLLVVGGIDLEAVQDEEGLHGGMRDSLVAIQERVVLHHRIPERRGLFDERRVEVDAIDRVSRLRQSGFKCPQVADTGSASRCVDDGLV
jgi:hypothetical protein